MSKKTFIGIILGIVAAGLIALIVVLGFKFFWKDNAPSEGSTAPQEITQGVLELESVDAKPGEEITIPIKFSNNPGVWAINLIANYDDELLTYVSCENGNLFDECESHASGETFRALFMQSDITNVDKSGKVGSITFKVSENAAAGKYTVKISEATSICNIDEVTVTPQYINCEITVK